MSLRSFLPLSLAVALILPALAARRDLPHHKLLRRADANGSSLKPGFYDGVTDDPTKIAANIHANISADLNLDLAGFVYGQDKIRGVNLGDVSVFIKTPSTFVAHRDRAQWLVLEKWLNVSTPAAHMAGCGIADERQPALFDATGNSSIIDEWTWGEGQPREQAENLMKRHWETWITEDDFAQIAGEAGGPGGYVFGFTR